MIQIITKNTYMYKGNFNEQETVISTFDEYKSFDLYDINIINLASNNLWESNSLNGEYLNDKSDLSTIKNSIETCNTKVVIIFPQNHYYSYDYSTSIRNFRKSTQLKSIKTKVSTFISKYIYEPLPEFNYEKGITKIDGEIYNSDFYFDEKESIIQCEKSKKSNTISLEERIVITTLNIFETPVNKEIEKRLVLFLNKIGFLTKNESAPQWIENISFYDDNIYQETIDKCNGEIARLNAIINENKEKINNNLKYKSILYSSGRLLSEQINKMLIEIFGLDDKFTDVYEEDFNFKFGNITFIVETKGLNNEVSGQNVSDAYNHLVIYEDRLESNGVVEETKCLFFVASERFKEPQERGKIKERQITIAKRNKTLIIDTPTFYNIFEGFRKQDVSVDDIFKMFSQNTGLLEYKKNTDEK